MSLAKTLWSENADLALVALEHRFVQSLADGSLPREAFAGYVAQDAYFLEAFARAYALGIAHSPDRAAMDAFTELLAGVSEELRLHTTYAERWTIDLSAIEPAASTLAYTDFLLATAALGGAGATCAAMTPCMRLYAYLGQSLSGRAVDTYAVWVSTYADPGFEALASTIEQLLDDYGDDAPATHRTYRRAMQLELAFFDSALPPPSS